MPQEQKLTDITQLFGQMSSLKKTGKILRFIATDVRLKAKSPSFQRGFLLLRI